MTLIWTVASRECVVHVSDRLTTWDRGGVANPAANKNVVYHGRDSVATIGFTGLANLDGVSSDRWLAKLILGTAVGGAYIGRIPTARLLPLSRLVQRIQDSLQRTFEGSENAHQGIPHAFVVAGWRFSSRGSPTWPFLTVIEKSPGGSEVLVRHFLSRRRWRFGEYSIGAFGTCPLSQDETESLRMAVSTSLRDPQRVAELLADATRLAARRSPRVGAHSMTSVIPAPHGRFDVAVRLRSDPAAPQPPLYYMPWIILGDDLAVPPSRLWTRYITDAPGMVFSGGYATVTTYR